MGIKIVAVGKIREKWIREGIEEYAKRLKRFTPVEIVEVADEKCPESLSEKEAIMVKDREGERVLAKIPAGSYVILLDLWGKEMDSEAFSERLMGLKVDGVSQFVFVIGGALGLSEALRARADWKLSFSKMTFPHPLMRLILMEQLYRAATLEHHVPYHK